MIAAPRPLWLDYGKVSFTILGVNSPGQSDSHYGGIGRFYRFLPAARVGRGAVQGHEARDPNTSAPVAERSRTRHGLSPLGLSPHGTAANSPGRSRRTNHPALP